MKYASVHVIVKTQGEVFHSPRIPRACQGDYVPISCVQE